MEALQTFGKEWLPQSMLGILAFLQSTKILHSIFQILEPPAYLASPSPYASLTWLISEIS